MSALASNLWIWWPSKVLSLELKIPTRQNFGIYIYKAACEIMWSYVKLCEVMLCMSHFWILSRSKLIVTFLAGRDLKIYIQLPWCILGASTMSKTLNVIIAQLNFQLDLLESCYLLLVTRTFYFLLVTCYLLHVFY